MEDRAAARLTPATMVVSISSRGGRHGISTLLDCAGRRRSPATLSSFHQGLRPRNKGLRYPPDPPTVEEIVAVMSVAGDGPDGIRLRGVIVVLWRARLRISEALSLNETDLDPERGALVVRAGECRIRHSPCYAGACVMPSLRFD